MEHDIISWNRIISVINSGKLDSFKSLLNSKININVQDINGITPLMYAAQHAYSEIVKEILRYNIDVNIRDIHGRTALMYVSFNNNQSKNINRLLITRELINKKIDINATDNSNRTALMYSILYNFKKITLELLKSGADIHIKDINNYTALYIAGNNTDIIDILKDHEIQTRTNKIVYPT